MWINVFCGEQSDVAGELVGGVVNGVGTSIFYRVVVICGVVVIVGVRSVI